MAFSIMTTGYITAGGWCNLEKNSAYPAGTELCFPRHTEKIL